MEGTHGGNYSCVEDQDDPEYSPEDIKDSPQAHNSTKRSKRASEKKVVCVPIKDVKGCRLKGETPPPSDSWAWRKYGQKPIKGSPYPRGYYRCSSSKGCPARKQVERSRTDPTMLVVTYSCEHNHSLPASSRYKYNSNNNNNNKNDTDKALHEPVATTAATEEVTSVSTNSTISSDDDMVVFGNQFINIAEEPLLSTYDFEFKWFSDLVSTSTTNESPILGITDSDGTMVFPLGEEDESLFADLGELPECSLVW